SIREKAMRTFTRRAIPALALGAAACATPVAARGQSLHALAAAKGMRFGAAMPHRALGDGLYLDLLRSECGLIVSENEHKWASIQPAQGVFNFAPADAMMAWAAENGLAYRGHTLVWHHVQWLPRWVNEYQFGANPAAEAEALLRAHV